MTVMHVPAPFILASKSQGRKEILERANIRFHVEPSSIDERSFGERDPVTRAVTLARMKALDIAGKHPDAFVLGTDSLAVASSGELLEKPIDETDARRMLLLQSGRATTLHTAMCLVTPVDDRSVNDRSGERTYCEGLDSAVVHFKNVAAQQIDAWIASGKWQNCAGAFRIEDDAHGLIDRIEGERTAVIGLSLPLLEQLLRQATE